MSSPLFFLSFTLSPHIHLIVLTSVQFSFNSCSTFIGQVSLPCIRQITQNLAILFWIDPTHFTHCHQCYIALPLWNIIHSWRRWFVQVTTVHWPQSTQYTKQRALATAIWTGYQQMHSVFHLHRINCPNKRPMLLFIFSATTKWQTAWVQHHCDKYTGCIKSSWPTLTSYNFDIGGPIFIIFHC